MAPIGKIWVIFNDIVMQLRTNNSGIYVIHDDDCRFLRYLSHEGNKIESILASNYASVMRGIVRGSLKSLGIESRVKVELCGPVQCTKS